MSTFAVTMFSSNVFADVESDANTFLATCNVADILAFDMTTIDGGQYAEILFSISRTSDPDAPNGITRIKIFSGSMNVIEGNINTFLTGTPPTALINTLVNDIMSGANKICVAIVIYKQ